MKKLFNLIFAKEEPKPKRTIETHGWEVGAKKHDDFHNYMKGLKHG
ncbi:TPA: hypothetical protein VA916_000965 [Streptococcus agalactiae]|nr:hypothetical protein [Streptococcus agalactiae]